MHHLAGPGRNLVIVKRGENVLRITAVDPASLPIEHIYIDEMRPGIDLVAIAQATALTQRPGPARHFGVHPDLIRVHCPLGERMPQPQRAQHHLEQVAPSRLELRHRRTQRRRQRAINAPTLPHPENIRAHGPAQECLLRPQQVRIAAHVRQRGVGGGEQMAVNEPRRRVGRVKEVRPEILRFLQRHVATRAIGHRLFRIIETAGAVAGDPAEQVRVIVILAPQELFVIIQLPRHAHLVAGGTELGRAHERLEELLLVKLRLGFHQLLVEILQQAVGAVGERVMDRFVDGVVPVSLRAVHMGDRVARGTRNPHTRRRMVHIVELRVVKRPAEEGHRIVAAGAPARRLDVAVAPQRHLPRLPHAEQVEGIVERAEMMRAVEPGLVSVLVARLAVIVHHQRPGRNELPRSRPRQRRLEILLPRRRTGPVFPGMRRVQQHHADHRRRRDRAPAHAHPPAQPRSGQPVQHIEPRHKQGRGHVRPVSHRPQAWVFQPEILELEQVHAHQQQARDQHREGRHQERVTDGDRTAVGPPTRVPEVQQAKHEHRQSH